MTLLFNLLDEPLIRTRLVAGGQCRAFSLPGLFAALVRDEVRDFPALRPHQRHPWHAFLVQLAAIALHHARTEEPLETDEGWRTALLSLTPEHPDGAAWYMVAPHDRPAFMQAPVPGGRLDGWSDDRPTPDSLDVLVTSKNHDLKQARIHKAHTDDWIYALVSLQTQAPYPGAGNSGVVRMNGGSSSRPGLGMEATSGNWGSRWRRDVQIALAERQKIVSLGYRDTDGLALIWVHPWDGKVSLAFSSLDPLFIEICRRVRLIFRDDQLCAMRTTSKGPRISKDESKARKGITGDLWTPIHIAEAKSVGITGSGFNYRRMVDLAFGTEYQKPPAQQVQSADRGEYQLIARAIAGGQSTTDGYHERRIPISNTTRRLLLQMQASGRANRLADVAKDRVSGISAVRNALKDALVVLFSGGKGLGKPGSTPEGTNNKALAFTQAFEQAEDARFFDDLNEEIESDQPNEVHLHWLLSTAERAEAVLTGAFPAGPQNCEQRYRARSAALSRFHGGLRNSKTLPVLAEHFRQQALNKELSHDLG